MATNQSQSTSSWQRRSSFHFFHFHLLRTDSIPLKSSQFGLLLIQISFRLFSFLLFRSHRLNLIVVKPSAYRSSGRGMPRGAACGSVRRPEDGSPCGCEPTIFFFFVLVPFFLRFTLFLLAVPSGRFNSCAADETIPSQSASRFPIYSDSGFIFKVNSNDQSATVTFPWPRMQMATWREPLHCIIGTFLQS